VWRLVRLGAHELRNPLAAALGALQVARSEDAAPATTAMMLAVAEEEMHRLGRLLDSFERRIAAGVDADVASAGARSVTDLRGVVGEAVGAHPIERTHTLAWSPGTDAVPVAADRDALRQVLDHLLTNAMTFAPAGSTVEVAVEAEGAWARAWVRDRGAGIPAEAVERMFEPHVRLSGEGGPPGLGLGLYVCRRIVEQHGGRVWLDPDAGAGTTFRLELPLAPAQPTWTGKGNRMSRLLVVDDEPNVALVAAWALRAAGHEVEMHTDARVALDWLMAQPAHSLAAVVLDLWMPHLDGRAFVARMRADDRLRAVPVILMTGALPDDPAMPPAGTYSACLRKPFEIATLRAAVAGAVDPDDTTPLPPTACAS